MRIGHGYDAHRLVPDRALILGGVKVPHELGLEGHSDADVLVHAVMDALLGAAGLCDIGVHFPDSNVKYKDACSLDLLAEIYAAISGEGLTIGNIDATVICQSPRLGPYREEMRRNIAKYLHTEQKNVNVKFTTEEGMGFTGMKQGIAAHAVCILE